MATEAKEVIQQAKPGAPSAGPAARKTDFLSGNEAAAKVAYALSEVVAIYPITPASPMGESVDAWSGRDQPNLWGDVPNVIEMQSEGGAAGTLHGPSGFALTRSRARAAEAGLLEGAAPQEWTSTWAVADAGACGADCSGRDPLGPCGGSDHCKGVVERSVRSLLDPGSRSVVEPVAVSLAEGLLLAALAAGWWTLPALARSAGLDGDVEVGISFEPGGDVVMTITQRN